MPSLTDARRMALSRRAALRWLAAGGLSLAAGRAPDKAIAAERVEELPYARMPEGVLPGIAQRYATALPLAGYARGVLVASYEGRPIKVDGNPRHPASLGAVDVFAQAEILSLYDPDRSQAIRVNGEISSWPAFATALRERMERHRADHGAGLRLLSGRVASPTLLDQIARLRDAFPAMRWHAFEPSDDRQSEAARAVYGRPLKLSPRLGDADAIVAFDADPLGPGPDQVRFARALSDRRKHDRATARLYVASCGMTLTGAAADHRLAARPNDIGAMVAALAATLGAPLTPPTLAEPQARFVAAAAKALSGPTRSGLVLVGPTLPAAQALGVWINDRLGAPIDAFEVDPREAAAATLAELADDLAAGKVETLIVADANPVYAAPGELDFGALYDRAQFRVHLGQEYDETAAASTWHLPALHPLESWTDGAASDRAISIVQPLIRPLYQSVSGHQLLAALAGEPEENDYDRLQAAWRARWNGQDFDARWRQALLDGVVEASPAPSNKPAATFPGWTASAAASELTAVFRVDPSAFDGRFANNAWLQECPQPLSKSTWGNAIEIARADAKRLGLEDGAEVEISVGDRAVKGPVRVTDGVAAGVVQLALGYGRTHCGAIGAGVGFSVAALQSAATPFVARAVSLRMTGRRAQMPPDVAGFVALRGEARELAPEFALGAIPVPPQSPPGASFNAPWPPATGDPYAWSMVVDTDACIGCNACVVACQAENNVPVVGPEEIARGRVMHWLRVDVYDHGAPEAPRPAFQPVPCMHCEAAPCEPVCPVEASVHDHEGLNVQVYNRCVGTRFCQSNCPYKVRRFNFFGYASGQEYRNLGDPLVKATNNPDVTVRARGVMEKCTYCVQRISAARRAAEREDRPIREGEVVTACQAACPTSAIQFGNLANPDSRVVKLRREPRHYALLDHLHTRPRTTYLARLRNPDPQIGDVT